MPVWHSSVSWMRNKYSVDCLTDRRLIEGVGNAIKQLNGVGGELMVFVTIPTGRAIHAQKPLTPSEIELLPDGWMDIPAWDDLGPVRFIDPKDPTNY